MTEEQNQRNVTLWQPDGMTGFVGLCFLSSQGPACLRTGTWLSLCPDCAFWGQSLPLEAEGSLPEGSEVAVAAVLLLSPGTKCQALCVTNTVIQTLCSVSAHCASVTEACSPPAKGVPSLLFHMQGNGAIKGDINRSQTYTGEAAKPKPRIISNHLCVCVCVCVHIW